MPWNRHASSPSSRRGNSSRARGGISVARRLVTTRRKKKQKTTPREDVEWHQTRRHAVSTSLGLLASPLARGVREIDTRSLAPTLPSPPILPLSFSLPNHRASMGLPLSGSNGGQEMVSMVTTSGGGLRGATTGGASIAPFRGWRARDPDLRAYHS